MLNLKILEFETKTNRYIFDGVTGTVLAVDDLILDCIKLMAEYNESDEVYNILSKKYYNKENVKSAVAFVQSYKEYGAFYINSTSENEKWNNALKSDTDMVKNFMQAGYTQQLILNVTEDCNMRCKYCFWSDEYLYSRNRTSKRMSLNTAISALTWFFQLMREIQQFNPGKKCAITFYGGEALLNFDVIKESIKYAINNCPVEPIFTITTNGTLLYGETADFLVQHNVNITVSLDGAQEVHDKNRVNATGQGTFDIIMKNISALTKKYPKYKKINFASVYDFSTNLLQNDLFFGTRTDIPPIGFISQVSNINTKYYDKYNNDDLVAFSQMYFSMIEKYIYGKVNNQCISSYLEMLFDIQFSNVFFRIRGNDRKPSILPYTSACIPGMKISVRADGKYDICEKINGTLPIGTIKDGLDVKIISEIIYNYNKSVTKNCYSCPINRQCSMCYALTCTDGQFEAPKCQDIIESYRMSLSIIFSILEENPHAYDFFLFKEEWALNA